VIDSTAESIVAPLLGRPGRPVIDSTAEPALLGRPGHPVIDAAARDHRSHSTEARRTGGSRRLHRCETLWTKTSADPSLSDAIDG
jgi:hypothetical protein